MNVLGEGCVQEVSCPLTPSLPFWDFLIRRARSLSLAASLSLSLGHSRSTKAVLKQATVHTAQKSYLRTIIPRTATNLSLPECPGGECEGRSELEMSGRSTRSRCAQYAGTVIRITGSGGEGVGRMARYARGMRVGVQTARSIVVFVCQQREHVGAGPGYSP